MKIGVLTVSDSCSKGTRADGGGPVLVEWAKGLGWTVGAEAVVADDPKAISEHLKRWCDDLRLDVVLTTGGTGLGPRDVTPEATTAVMERGVPGVAEALREEGRRHTPFASLSRGVCALRGRTLIVNLPGSPKSLRQSFPYLETALPHAVKMTAGHGHDRPVQDAGKGRVLAVCLSTRKGDKKKPIGTGRLVEGKGLEGDVHADGSHRQLSLLAVEAARTLEAKGLAASPGDFAENLTTEGVDFSAVKIGDRVSVGETSLLEVTQIGKECHDRCAIFHQVGDCVMPRSGIFARIVRGGMVHVGDKIALLS